ncbi:hypothetical protein SAMN06265368_3181 [Cohaesibacter gelatinilyticus]|uniref:Uncharacterized protein n=1 Tax=Cohaesibacter gelatinilyticus TaxID=372072 RepID=A0A285PEC6_9HYPH|nr:hypothetical protein SAMN06265368_3181 [Cohaesibacter gelatinilyticus]
MHWSCSLFLIISITMTNTLTDSEKKIQSLQSSLLYLKAWNDKCLPLRFVAWIAYGSEDPMLTLKQLSRRSHASLPENSRDCIREMAKTLLRELHEIE